VAALHLFGGEAGVCGGEERMQGCRVRVAHPEQRQSNAMHAQQDDDVAENGTEQTRNQKRR
jgi:hypothetical protein